MVRPATSAPPDGWSPVQPARVETRPPFSKTGSGAMRTPGSAARNSSRDKCSPAGSRICRTQCPRSTISGARKRETTAAPPPIVASRTRRSTSAVLVAPGVGRAAGAGGRAAPGTRGGNGRRPGGRGSGRRWVAAWGVAFRFPAVAAPRRFGALGQRWRWNPMFVSAGPARIRRIYVVSGRHRAKPRDVCKLVRVDRWPRPFGPPHAATGAGHCRR